ncbi:MAG: hypothetical protein HEP71_07330 [Roseivirga sp.]|nr:hypothetical protein [Roseivirga sp.]
MKELHESDLQIGDILIFENQDFDAMHLWSILRNDKHSWEDNMYSAAFYLLLYLIPWFDPGDEGDDYKNIYHAAIWGNIDPFKGSVRTQLFESKIVQAGTSGIGSAHLYDTMIGHGVKNVYVCRRKEQLTGFFDKITKATRGLHNQTDIQYSYETAWLLAVICSLRYSDGALYEMLKAKLGKTGADLMVTAIQMLINKYNDEHQKEMVACSTLVGMIYKNAGFQLAIEDHKEKKDPEIHMPAALDFRGFDWIPGFKTDTNIPKVNIKETVVTPRQLMESPDVEIIGYFPYKGS